MKFFKKPALNLEVIKAIESLESIRRARVELATPARTLSEILRVVFQDESERIPYEVSPTNARATWGQELPIFLLYPPPLDPALIRERMLAVASIVERFSTDPKWFRHELKRGAIDVEDWAFGWIRGERQRVLTQSRDLGLGDEFVGVICRFALLPTLAKLQARIPPPTAWRRADCPFCGGKALLAELRGLEQERFLRCGVCAADWPTSSLGCPTCGESDPWAVRWVGIEGESDRRRLQLCDGCGSRLKMLSTLTPLTPSGLVAAELELLHLDFV